MIGISVPNLTGGFSAMMPNHHITKPVLIGEVKGDGQFNVVWQTSGTVVANEWSPYLEGSRDLIADWRAPLMCGNFNVKTGKTLDFTPDAAFDLYAMPGDNYIRRQVNDAAQEASNFFPDV